MTRFALAAVAALLPACWPSAEYPKACLDTAAAKWSNAVSVCALEGKDADACGLDALTEQRRLEEEACFEGGAQ